MKQLIKRKSTICSLTILIMVCAFVFILDRAEARITRIEVQSVVPAGLNFEQIDGIARGEVDPSDPRNAIIQDIELAPMNSRGNVDYTTEFRILRPTNGDSGILLYDVVNRGNPLSELVFGPSFSVPSVPRERGYISVWSGWQGDLLDSSGLNIQVPVATYNAWDRNAARAVCRQRVPDPHPFGMCGGFLVPP